MKKLLLLYTGGTIGMVQDQKGILVPFDFNNITENVPELSRLDYQVVVISFDPILDSSNMNMDTWIEMASIIEKNYDDYDGFVILHGSDTMAYTASALSFMLENLAKPVILTGSQLPIGEIRTDAKENLITSVEIASAHKNGVPVISEVCLYFEYQLFRANRTTKISAEQFEAFASMNFPPLAESGVHLKFNQSLIQRKSNKEQSLVIRKKLVDDIVILKLFPGITNMVIESILNTSNLKGVLKGLLEGNSCVGKPTLDNSVSSFKTLPEKKLSISFFACWFNTEKSIIPDFCIRLVSILLENDLLMLLGSESISKYFF